MMGVFGGYTRWAVVFLIIFVLFFLLCPGGDYVGGAPADAIAVSHYDYDTTTTSMHMDGYVGGTMGMYSSPDYSESESSL